jgi:aminoglycoside/choline kinase family phosphotransferase
MASSVDDFLKAAGWDTAQQTHLAGDASERRYTRLLRGADKCILMHTPPESVDDPAAFVAISHHLAQLNISAPQIYFSDLTQGLLLIEDFGDALFAPLMAADPTLERPLYRAATDVIASVQAAAPLRDIPDMTAQDWAQAACFALDWYRFAICGDTVDTPTFKNRLADLLNLHADTPKVMILRDYHADNLLWLDDRTGVARVGVLDFQLAQLGRPAYDLVSLLQDARRDVSPLVQADCYKHFIQKTGCSESEFSAQYAVVGAQRALRILGVFARLCLVKGKPDYLRLLPRVWRDLSRNLCHPALADFAKFCETVLPSPTQTNLERIASKCGQHR